MTTQFTATEALELANDGKARIVDVRGPKPFGVGHPPGSISLPYSARGLESRLSILISPDRPIIILANELDQLDGAIEQLSGSSFQLRGAIEIDKDSSGQSEILSVTVKEVSIEELLKSEYHILDVREQIEWEMGYIPGSILISLGELRSRMDELDPNVGIAVICEAGIRSSSAVSILQANGFTNVVDVPDGAAGCRSANIEFSYYDG